jgi:acid stress-induced BolA-like protein IbaG/YrbA
LEVVVAVEVSGEPVDAVAVLVSDALGEVAELEVVVAVEVSGEPVDVVAVLVSDALGEVDEVGVDEESGFTKV